MDVAVAGVKDVDDPQPYFSLVAWMKSQDLRQLRARDDAVLRAVARARAGRSRRTPACGTSRAVAAPPASSPGGLRGHRCFAQMSTIRVGLLIDGDFEAVDFDEQHRPGVQREAEVERRFDRLDDPLVHHLQRGRDDARADDVADRLGRASDGVEDAEHRAVRRRVARQPHPDLRARCRTSPRCRRTGRSDRSPATSSHGPPNCTTLAVGQHDLDAQHVIDGDAVLERVRPAGVGGDVAADRAGPLADDGSGA